jgi:hypothetical protein
VDTFRRKEVPVTDTLAQPRVRDGRQAIAGKMSEAELERRIRRIVRDLRKAGFPLLGYHTHDSRKSPEGFPDWVYASIHGHIFRELKREHEKPAAAQEEWLMILQAGGADAGVWRPSDLVSGRIGRELAVLAGAIPGGEAE